MINIKDFPLCEKEVSLINDRFNTRGWVTLYEKGRVFSALITEDKTEAAIANDAWDLCYWQTAPWINNPGGTNVYMRYYEDGVQPIVLIQEPKGVHIDEKVMLSEEFVMFYDLRQVGNKYVQVDECGDDQDVAVIKDDSLLVNIKYIKEFIELKKMNLLIFIDTVNNTPKTLAQLGCEKPKERSLYYDEGYIFSYSLLDSRGYSIGYCNTSACFRGKVIYRHNANDIRQLWDFHDDRYTDFIISVNEYGDDITRTCDEKQLSWERLYPETLTPVYFKRTVLDRFYNSPNQYEVQDGYVCDNTQWGLRFDNDRNDEYVVATLVDLGRLPYKEQICWRGYNVQPPADVKWSETTFKRWFLGEPTDADTSPVLAFKNTYNKINRAWEDKYQWPLFLEQAPKDQHHYTALHSMSVAENDKEFDSLILSIVRLLIDSLNESKILKTIDDTKTEVCEFFKEKEVLELKKCNIKGGISKFEALLISEDIKAPDLIKLLRNLQELRSTTAAHRKSRKPDKKALALYSFFGLDQNSEQECLDGILIKANEYLLKLLEVIK